MAEARLTYIQLDLPEVLPEHTGFLDEYQENAWLQISWDKNGQTIRGRQPAVYMADGIVEEVGELYEADKVEPAYSRLGALLSQPGIEGASLNPGEITHTAIVRHTKEFGDVSWYLANMLRILGVKLSRAYEIGLVAWKLDDMTQLRSTPEFTSEINRTMPALRLLSYAGELAGSACTARALHPWERSQANRKLVIAGGKFVLASMLIAPSRFGSSYQEFLDGNRVKLDKRIAEGTIFDKTGGDDR